MSTAFGIDPRQQLSEPDELTLVRRGAELGYQSAWTPSGPDSAAFDRCIRWHQASGLPVAISVVPASGRPPEFYAGEARRVWEATGGQFILGVGSGQLEKAAEAMPPYLAELRRLLAGGPPIYVAALGPLMLRLAGEVGDGVSLNWCSPERVGWSRDRVETSATAAGRQAPPISEYIRTSVDPDPEAAARALWQAATGYALGPVAYRRHFDRMGFGGELKAIEETGRGPSRELLAACGAHGRPGEVRSQFERLAGGLDLAIARVLVTEPGSLTSALRVLEECAPG